MLNPLLIQKQKLDNKSITKIEKLHFKKNRLFNKAKKWLKKGKIKKLQKGARKLEKIEYQMQECWGFKQDENFHTHWLSYPGCDCPKMYNHDAYGIHRIINCKCLAHSFMCEE
ncbi:MAG: hypothetical protein KAI79_18610 [Bacteroidales bacterium]|nr:hypothetical protein [Bacteroidales bacterium]